MMHEVTTAVLAWLITYGIHSTIIGGATLLLLRFLPTRWTPLRERILKIALLGGAITATLFLVFPTVSSGLILPLATSQVELPVEEVSSAITGEKTSTALTQAYAAPTELAASSERQVWRHIPWMQSLLWLWGLIVLVVGLRYAARWCHFSIHLKKDPVSSHSLLYSTMLGLQQRLGIKRKVLLFMSPAISSPMAVGARAICLPEDFERRLTPAEQQSVLAHELAHLQCNHPLWFLIGEVFGALFFFQPLNRMLVRHLRAEAEFLADTIALSHIEHPVVLAKSLVKFAQPAFSNLASVPTSAMAGTGASLTERTKRMLTLKTDTPMKRIPFGATLAIISMVLCVGWLAPKASPETSTSFTLAHTAIQPIGQEQQVSQDSTASGTVLWLDGNEYAIKLEVTTSGYEKPAGEREYVLDISWEGPSPTFSVQQILLKEDPIGQEDKSRVYALLGNNEKPSLLLREIGGERQGPSFKQVLTDLLELCKQEGIPYSAQVQANMDQFARYLVGVQARK